MLSPLLFILQKHVFEMFSLHRYMYLALLQIFEVKANENTRY